MIDNIFDTAFLFMLCSLAFICIAKDFKDMLQTWAFTAPIVILAVSVPVIIATALIKIWY